MYFSGRVREGKWGDWEGLLLEGHAIKRARSATKKKKEKKTTRHFLTETKRCGGGAVTEYWGGEGTKRSNCGKRIPDLVWGGETIKKNTPEGGVIGEE